MSNINSVIIGGNLTRDPEVKPTASGSALHLGIAVTDRAKNTMTGEWEDKANYFEAVLYGNRAPALKGMLLKGSKVVLNGRLRHSVWEKDGNRHSKVDIVFDEIEVMG